MNPGENPYESPSVHELADRGDKKPENGHAFSCFLEILAGIAIALILASLLMSLVRAIDVF